MILRSPSIGGTSASKVIEKVKSDDLRTNLATYYTLSKDNALTPEEMRQKAREYMPRKPKTIFISVYRTQGGANNRDQAGINQEFIWTKSDHVRMQISGSASRRLHLLKTRDEEPRLA